MALQVVTGGAGFIGSHIVGRLLRDGDDVLIVDDFTTGTRRNLESVRLHPRLRVEHVTVLDGDALARLFNGARFVFHQAAVPSVQRSVQFPLETNDVNIKGTLNVLLAAHRAGVERVVYASSSSVYGDAAVLPKTEELLPQPLSPYALQKYVGELYASIALNLFSVSSTCLRYFNVFGPRQDPDSEYSAVIPRFVTAMLNGRPPVIYGDGEQSRDFTYVDNVVDANVQAARSPKANGQVMNIASGERVSLNRLVNLLNELLGTNMTPVYAPCRPGDVRHSHACVRKARRLIEFQPRVDFRSGLMRTIEWYASNFVSSTSAFATTSGFNQAGRECRERQ